MEKVWWTLLQLHDVMICIMSLVMVVLGVLMSFSNEFGKYCDKGFLCKRAINKQERSKEGLPERGTRGLVVWGNWVDRRDKLID